MRKTTVNKHQDVIWSLLSIQSVVEFRKVGFIWYPLLVWLMQNVYFYFGASGHKSNPIAKFMHKRTLFVAGTKYKLKIIETGLKYAHKAMQGDWMKTTALQYEFWLTNAEITSFDGARAWTVLCISVRNPNFVLSEPTFGYLLHQYFRDLNWKCAKKESIQNAIYRLCQNAVCSAHCDSEISITCHLYNAIILDGGGYRRCRVLF